MSVTPIDWELQMLSIAKIVLLECVFVALTGDDRYASANPLCFVVRTVLSYALQLHSFYTLIKIKR